MQKLAHIYAHLANYVLRALTYQQAVKKDVKKDPQAADDQVEQVVQELHVCNHSFVATSEGSTVPDKAHEEDDLVAELKNNENRKVVLRTSGVGVKFLLI